MSTNALKILAATDPPKRLLIDDETLREVANICPALLARIQAPGAGRDKFTIGIMASFNRILISFEAIKMTSILSEITDDMMAEVDALLSDSPKELNHVLTELPLILELMEESGDADQKSEALGGIVLTYVTVARHLMESVISDVASGIIEESEEPIVSISPFVDPSDGYKEAETTAPEPQNPASTPYFPDIKDVVKKLASAGVNMKEIQIQPHVITRPTGDDIIFRISGPLPHVDFDTIAQINAMFMKATGRGISLESSVPVNFTFQV